LLKLYIKKHRTYPDGEKEYFEFQKYQAVHLIGNILTILPLNRDHSVCDYGCGKGGYTLVLNQYFENVLGVDFYRTIYKEDLSCGLNFKKANLITYRGEPKDFLFCASVIEHIPENRQKDFINNLKTNIKEGGYLYLSFPPFKSINGGHLAAPFHYLPDKIALWLMRKTREKDVYTYEKMFGEYGLTKTSIEKVEGMLKDADFEIIKIGSRYMPNWYIKLFAKNNFLNWHVEFFCKRKRL
jgi:2-polyprenyl-3-methyl-5-hydroxy-6-metoxy-1,4-benzoquinol methylase